MSVEIRVPALGESIVDAVIATWLKHEGDAVSVGDALVELETDKVNVEVSAEQSGVLQKIVKKEGDEVAVGDVIGMIGETAQQVQSQPATTAPAPATVAQPAAGVAEASADSDGQRPASPIARRIAAENNIDLAQIQGNSPHGRVTREDVINYIEQSSQSSTAAPGAVTPLPQANNVAPVVSAQPTSASIPAPSPKPQAQPEPGGREERVRLSRRRQTIAQRLVEAQHNAAMLTTFNEIDMSAVMEIRSRPTAWSN